MTVFGYIPLRLVDLFEIALVAFILYRLYMMMRGTLAVSILAGALALYVVYELVQVTDMKILTAVFGALNEVYLFGAIVVFHPEIRKFLRLIVQAPLVRQIFGSRAQEEEIVETVAAVRAMSAERTGALIVFQRLEGLRSYIDSGQRLMAEVSRDLITSIFHYKSPLHDGAVIVTDGRIAAARCILPVSGSMRLDSALGTRHRAAMGLAEETDAVVVVVSEETGNISVAKEGTITSGLTPEVLQATLVDVLRGGAAIEAQAPEMAV